MSRGADPDSLCRFLEWDSGFFGARIATVARSALDASAMESALAWCEEHRIDCLYLLSALDDLATLRLAEQRGFRLTDVRVTLATKASAAVLHPAEVPGLRLRPAAASDVPAMRPLAAASHGVSRFFADEHFDRERCRELYATWVENSFRGYADIVWVAELDGRFAGYLTCHRRDDGHGEMGLLGVPPELKGRGVGRALVDRGTTWFREQGCPHLRVITQGANVSAQHLFQSAGYRTEKVELWHHRWFGPARERRDRP